MAISDKRKESMYNYAKKNLKRIPLDVQKEKYEEIKAAVESMVYEDMVLTSIAEKEKITVSDDEYTQYVENNLDTYGMSSVEEFESTYSKESVMDELLREKVQKFLLDNAKVTEVSEDEYQAFMKQTK